MEDVNNIGAHLQDVRGQAAKLSAAADALGAIFEDEGAWLRRVDQVACLKTLLSYVLGELESAKRRETSASLSHSKVSLVGSLFRLGAGLITRTSEGPVMQAISRQLLAGSNAREPPFGTVLVRIGPRGLPEDVEAVSISSLARESGQDESEVIERLLAGGNLLVSKESLSHLIDRLAGEILEGRLGLPVSAARLSQLQERRVLRLNPKNKDEPPEKDTLSL